MGNVVFFNGQDGSGPSLSDDLWVSDGTAAGTFAVGGARSAGIAGTERAGLDPTSITSLGGGVLFNGINSQFRGGVWFSNGTAAGTYEIGGINSSGVVGVPSGGLFATNITVFGDKALFINQNVNDINGLWVTNGAASGTFELGGPGNKGIAGRHFSGLVPEDLTSAGNKVIFVATDTDDFRGLWVTDGTTSGTAEIGGLNNAGISGAPTGEFDPPALESFGNDVIFTFGGSIWVSDGTAAGTIDIANGLTANEDLTVFGAKALFEDSEELWITDGTAAGTKEIGGPGNAGIAGAIHGLWVPHNFTVFGNKVIFTADDSVGGVNALWITDGTAAGTTEIGGLKNAGIPGQGRFALSPNPLVSVGSKFLFTAADPSGVSTLWVTDGTAAGTFELGGVNNAGVVGAPAAGLDPGSITASGGIGYFMSPDSTGTSRLWETDGTVAGTHVVAAGPTGLVSGPTDLTAVDLGAFVNADIFWQNTGTGQASIWDIGSDSLVAGGPVSPNPGPGWKTIGSGDFNADGSADILWQNANGQAAIWEMNGTTLIGGGTVTPNPGPSWTAIGTGDFNHDGHSDILWQNSDGQAAVWEMNGNTVIGGGAVTPNPGPGWKAVGTGDFNDDGNSDILWQNADGQAAIWEMNGNTLIGGGTVTPNPGPGWKAIGAGDFNDDGHSDIVWQNASSGQVAIWEMDSNKVIGGGTVSSNPGPSWHAIGTGGEGSSDILFQSTSGQTAIWDMSGTTIVAGGTVGPNPGSSWRAVGLGL